MAFISINEVDKFSYNDCICVGIEEKENKIVFDLESLIVRGNNSQNSNYTDSYADATVMTIAGGKIIKVLKVGYEYYDANDNLIESVPDEECALDSEDWTKKFTKTFLTEVKRIDENLYSLVFEMPDEDPSAVTDSFEMIVSGDKVSFSWERYMNRVQY